jgi:hypothetical protein
MSIRSQIDARYSVSTLPEMPFREIIEAEERERRETYSETLKDSGRIIPPEEFARRDKGESQLEMMGHRVAERLERLRRPGYHKGEDVFFVGANSENQKEIPKFWRSNANPYVQRQKRRNIFKNLALYMQNQIDDGAAFRMWVIHDGPRCHAMHLPQRWAAQAARVTDWNESTIAQKLDVKVVLRSAEAGSPVLKATEKTLNQETGKWERLYIVDEAGNRIPVRDDKGRQTWHPHSHLIVRFGRWLSEDEFKEVIKAAQAHFKTPKLDAGFIYDPREACKYVLKCDELDSVRDIDFLRFLKWTYKRRLVSFYGEAKEQKKRIERDGLRIKSEWDAKTQTTKYVERKSHHVNVVKKSDLEKPWSPPNRDKTVLVAKLEPLAYFSPISEPIFLVRGRVDWSELYKKPEVVEVIESSQEGYEAALDAFPLIYGCTVDEFLNGAQAFTTKQQRAELGFNFVENRAVSLGSAHTPPVISRESSSDSLHASQSAKPDREKFEQREEPIGPPKAVSRSQPDLKTTMEPPGAANRSQSIEITGSPSLDHPDFNPSEYFGGT